MIYLLLLIYCLNLIYIKRKQLYKSSFILHFFFISIIFIGPSIYYECGGTAYSKSFEWEDFLTFEKYGIFVFSCTLIYLSIFTRLRISLYNSLFVNYKDRNKNLILIYFGFWYFIVFIYLIIHFNELPVVNFLLTGSLPDRLDQTSTVKLFYTFSSIFMVFIPSGYFYLIRYLRANFTKLVLLVIVTFILISGGHKGLVAFFIIFALLFSGYRFTLKQVVVTFIAGLGLLYVYTLTKGREFNKETFYYLLESPPRRFFVTQGSAFITRISMERRDLYQGNINEYQLIKKQTYQRIYGAEEIGAAPTIFLGDFHVKYGPVITGLSYVAFLIFIFPFIRGTDNMKQRRLYLWWNLFILFYLLGFAELSMPSFLRILLALFNFGFLLVLPFITLRTDER